MVKVKKMNESFFAKLLKELNVAGELVRARQEEKQGLLDEFNKTSKRFFFGKISERTLAASARKTNKELQRLDRSIRDNIKKAKAASDKAAKLTSDQAPIGYKATLSGVTGGVEKKKKVKKVKKKVVRKKKPVKKKAKKKVKKKVVRKKKVVKRKAKKKTVKRKTKAKKRK